MWTTVKPIKQKALLLFPYPLPSLPLKRFKPVSPLPQKEPKIK